MGTEELSATTLDVYRVRDDFLSRAEASFFHVLRLVVADRFVICPKVRLADLFFVTRPHENRGAANRIASKHVDFVLLDPASLKPVAALELDDSSHQKARAAERDEFKDQVFASAGLPLIRVPAQRAYDVQQVSALLATALPTLSAAAPIARSEVPATEPAPPGPPTCPNCSVPMTLRNATRGANAGGEFWGCPNYPKCRSVLPVGS
ncbi:MAG: DUF2726 domain-containing protein [Armatimonadota bacterium]